MTQIERIKAYIDNRLEKLNPKKGEFMGRPLRDVNPKTFLRESELEKMQAFIESLEKEQDVDLDKEYESFVTSDPVYSKLVNGIVGKAIARHFYDLGLNARKEK